MTESQPTEGTAPNDPNSVLHRLAISAHGLTGADIQRLVKEAKQQARRAKRSLSYDDLEHAIRRGRPGLSPEVRWRVSVHEAGHAIAWTITRTGRVVRLSTGQPSGGQTEILIDHSRVEDETLFQEYLTCIVSG